jgi:hypothetical protein
VRGLYGFGFEVLSVIWDMVKEKKLCNQLRNREKESGTRDFTPPTPWSRSVRVKI